MGMYATCVEFSGPPPGLEEIHERFTERCGHEIVWRQRELAEEEVRDAELRGYERPGGGTMWLAELLEAQIGIRVNQLREAPPRAEFFQELSWTTPTPTPPHWQVIVTGHLTLQQAVGDVLREAGGRGYDEAASFSGPIDIAHLRRELARARRYSWIGLPILIGYMLLILVLMPVWFPLMLGFATREILRWRRRQSWIRRNKMDPLEAAAEARFARYLLRRIGGSGGKIGATGFLFGSQPRCRMPARRWAARNEVGPWGGAAAIVRGLCHTASGSPWYIQFADGPAEPLADWLNREMRHI